MGGGIAVDLSSISRNRHDPPIGVRDDRSDRNVAAGSGVDRAVQRRAHPLGEQSLPVSHHLVARDHCALIPRRSAIDVNCSSG